MKIRILMVTVSDSAGGASKAAFRLHRGLRGTGNDSRMLVANKETNDPDILTPGFPCSRAIRSVFPRLDTLPKRLYTNRNRDLVFYPGLVGEVTARGIERYGSDLVHLHWIQQGFLSLGAIGRLQTPVVWTLHDSWPFTGGCHLPLGCLRYRQTCGACPELGSKSETDLSRWVWERKRRAWANADMTIVAPSRWIADCAASSSLFSGRTIRVIPNGLDTDVFYPRDRMETRRKLQIPMDRTIVLFGGHKCIRDKNKGAGFLVEAINRLKISPSGERLELIIFGDNQDPSSVGFNVPVKSMGYVQDEELLAMYYSSADLFVAPSIQDNLPNTVMEAMACGAPCVAFDIGGMPDMIEHRRTGYLAKPGDAADLAAGMAWVLDDDARAGTLAAEGIRKAEAAWSLPVVARKHLELYREILDV